MNNSEQFIEKYKELENIAVSKYGNVIDNKHGAVAQLEEMPLFYSIKSELKYIRELRNFFQHNKKIADDYPVQATDNLLLLIDSIIDKVKNPEMVYNKSIKFSNICYAGKDDLIYDYMLKMKENVYTHIPILDNKVVIGVFSENSLLGALTEEEIIYDKFTTRFNDELIFKHCLIDNHVTEVFEFVSKNTYLEDVKEMFKKSFSQHKRLSLIFITEHGRKDEKLLGIITPWDVLG